MNKSLFNVGFYILFVILSIVFLYLFSFGTSSLYPTYGYDSEIFILIGKAINEGKMLYKDIFDHKGPILFFINALGYKLGGISGIFFLQVVNLTLIQILVYKISYLFLRSRYLSLVPIIGVFIIFSYSIDDGDLSEEYSIPFILLALYLFLKYLSKKTLEHPYRYSLIYGVCFSAISLIRLNNAAVVCCILLILFIHLIVNHRYENLFKNILWFILGFCLVFLPITYYFIYNDAFYDFIYATFIFNIKYSQSFPRAPFLSLTELTVSCIVLLPILLLYIALYIYRKKFPSIFTSLFILIGIVSFVSIRMGGGLLHYQMLNVIPFILGINIVILILRDREISFNQKIFIIIFLSLISLIFLFQARKIIWQYYSSRDKTQLYNMYRASNIDKELIYRLIPKNERNSVFGYKVRAHWFIETDILPAYKYFTNQLLWISIDREQVYDGMNNFLINTPPKWIVIPKHHLISWTLVGAKDYPILQNLLARRYEIKGEDCDYTYYHLYK